MDQMGKIFEWELKWFGLTLYFPLDGKDVSVKPFVFISIFFVALSKF